MAIKGVPMRRRQFLKTTAGVGAMLAVPQIIPASALGKDGAVAPSERIVLGGIGIGNRGTYDLGCFLQQPDVQFVAVCDVKEARRTAIKEMADQKYGNRDCDTYRDFRDLLARDDIDAVLIATGPNWHATAAIYAARAGKDMYCEKPCTKNIAQSLPLAETMRRTGRVFQAGTQRRNLPHFAFACELARTGRLGKLKDRPRPPGRHDRQDERLGTGRARTAQGRGRLGSVPGPGGLATVQQEDSGRIQLREGRRPGRRRRAGMGFALRRPLPVGRRRRRHGPGRIQPAGERRAGRPLCQRRRADHPRRRLARRWVRAPCGSKATTGWVETGDSGKLVLSSPALLAGRKVAEIGGYPATFHVRDFLDCVKTRSQPKANAEAACYSHIACHAANIAIFLDRKLQLRSAEERVHRRRAGQSPALRSAARTVEDLSSVCSDCATPKHSAIRYKDHKHA